MFKSILFVAFLVVLFENIATYRVHVDHAWGQGSNNNHDTVQVAGNPHDTVQVADNPYDKVQVADNPYDKVQVADNNHDTVHIADLSQFQRTNRKKRHLSIIDEAERNDERENMNENVLTNDETISLASSLISTLQRKRELQNNYHKENNVVITIDVSVAAPSHKQKRSHPLELFRNGIFRNTQYGIDSVGIRNIEDISLGAGESKGHSLPAYFRSNTDVYGSKDYRTYNQGGRSQFHVPHKSINSDSYFQSRPDSNIVPIFTAAGAGTYMPIQNNSIPSD